MFRHVGSAHTQIDALERLILEGLSYIQGERRKTLDIKGVDVDGGDGISCERV